MMLYDFKCPHCNTTFALMVNYEDKNLKMCNNCGEEDAWRMVPAPMIMTASHRDGTGRFKDLKEITKEKRYEKAEKRRTQQKKYGVPVT
jgi:putative FmdB family regulatory protein